MRQVREDASTGSAVLGTIGYDDLGRRKSLTRSSGLVTRYSYDGGSRLTLLEQDFGANGNDLAWTMSYNPAGQISSRGGDHDLYVFTGHGSGSTASTIDGQNRIVFHGSAGFGYDWKGNLVNDGSTGFAYDSESRLVSASGARNATLSYDPLGRL